MILSDRDIKRALKEGRIVIDPFPDIANCLGPCSLDFRLGSTFRIFEYNKFPVIDPRQKEIFDALSREVTISSTDPFIIHPGELVVATTIEWLELSDDLIGRLEGRSSLGRIGVIVHSTAARFDPGWRGKPVLELGNLGRIPVALYPGMKICAFTFEELSSPAEVPYHSKVGAKYLSQGGPTASKLSEEV